MGDKFEYQETETNLKFFEVLRSVSDNQYDPLPEWELLTDKFMEREIRCICTTPIERNFFIRHKRTGKELVIGSECVKRWLNPFAVCSECQSPLGRITKRIETKDFVCPECKRDKKKKETARRNQLATFRFYWGGYGTKHYKNKFCDVIDDIPYVEHLLNLSLPSVPPSLQAFYEYVNLVFTVKEILVPNFKN